MTRWLDDREQRVWRSWLQASDRLEAHLARRMQADGDLSMSDFAVLVPLSEAPDQRLRAFALGRALQWEKSRLSHHLTRMERRGLVSAGGLRHRPPRGVRRADPRRPGCTGGRGAAARRGGAVGRLRPARRRAGRPAGRGLRRGAGRARPRRGLRRRGAECAGDEAACARLIRPVGGTPGPERAAALRCGHGRPGRAVPRVGSPARRRRRGQGPRPPAPRPGPALGAAACARRRRAAARPRRGGARPRGGAGRRPVPALLVAASYAAFTAFVLLARSRGGVLASCGCFGRADTPPTTTHVVVTAAPRGARRCRRRDAAGHAARRARGGSRCRPAARARRGHRGGPRPRRAGPAPALRVAR